MSASKPGKGDAWLGRLSPGANGLGSFVIVIGYRVITGMELHRWRLSGHYFCNIRLP
jgi:hypothetical protein